MPSRVHYVYMSGMGQPRFDSQARAYFQESIRRKCVETLGMAAAEREARRLERLPMNWRKAIPLLQEIAVGHNFTFAKKLRKFWLPKHLRRAKNPIFSWKTL